MIILLMNVTEDQCLWARQPFFMDYAIVKMFIFHSVCHGS